MSEAHSPTTGRTRLTDLFIHRAVLSCVISILVLVFGLRAEQSMPIEKFPHTVRGGVEIQTQYYGADPATVAGFVTTPIEGAVSQAQGIDYMTSSSTTGTSDIEVTLKLGYDPTRALAEITSYVSAATAQFPAGVQQPSISLGISGQEVMDLAINSDDLSFVQIADFARRVIGPRLQSVPGVQSVDIQGAPNTVMRAWLDPDRMAALGLTPAEVSAALSANNFITGVGNTLGHSVSVTLNITSGLHTAEQFRDLVIRQNANHIIRLGDVARVEFGSDPDTFRVTANGQSGVYIQIKPTATANTLAVAQALSAQIATLRHQIPPTLHISILSNSGDYIRNSIHEVVITLLESLVIVSLVVFAFLGSPRAVVVPLVTIPLSLIGTFALMAAMGFSINLLTLLALVLAIGLVVDDAIIIVENVNRHLAEGLTPLAAASAAASELLQPILAMTVVLIAVYVPLGLQGGLTGALFIEFAFTLAAAVSVSALLALTLSPMMSARLLRARSADGHRPSLGERIEHASERALESLQRRYSALLRHTLRQQPTILILGCVVLLSSWYFYQHSKHELSPAEDTGELVVSGNGAPDATLEALSLYDDAITDIYRSVPEQRDYWHVVSPPSVQGGLSLVDWNRRHRDVFTISHQVQAKLQKIPGLELAIFVPPYLPGSWGLPVQYVLQSTGDVARLGEISDAFLARMRASGKFVYADKDLKIDQPQSTIVVDRAKLSTLNLTMNDLGNSLNNMLGGGYVGFFATDQRSYKVEPLVARRFRLTPEQILDYPIKSVNGVSVPLRSVAHIVDTVVPESIAHFQQLNATTIQALPAPGITQGEAYDYLQNLAAQMLPSGYTTDTVGSLRQFVHETGGFAATFALAVIITYLALAALFESFRDPLIILVSVPMSIAGALLFVWLGIGGASINLFTEVGLVTLMGLISKHGILIVEVAKEAQGAGMSKRDAIERACALRLRPILMTTAAMVLGVMPLVLATGAGAASRYVMGLVIAAGLAIGTLFTLFVLPAVYMLLASDRGVAPNPTRG